MEICDLLNYKFTFKELEPYKMCTVQKYEFKL